MIPIIDSVMKFIAIERCLLTKVIKKDAIQFNNV